MSTEKQIDQAILGTLFNGYLNCAELGRQLAVSVSELEERLTVLRQLGYGIEVQPHRGYALTLAPDIIISDEIAARIPGNIFARQLLVYRETSSTNNLVFHAANDGATEGFCVLAESQTHGKGRHGRTWLSTQCKGLWLSLLFRPDWPVANAARLTYLASIALCRSVKQMTGLSCSIKWPNDVFVDNKKLAGILTEIHSSNHRLNFAVVGIGCNIHHEQNDFPAELHGKITSLTMAGANPQLRRADLLVSLLAELERLYRLPWTEVYEQWRQHCLSIGKTIQVQTGKLTVSGQMVDLSTDGSLLLRLPDGRIETIPSGDVLW